MRLLWSHTGLLQEVAGFQSPQECWAQLWGRPGTKGLVQELCSRRSLPPSPPPAPGRCGNGRSPRDEKGGPPGAAPPALGGAGSQPSGPGWPLSWGWLGTSPVSHRAQP